MVITVAMIRMALKAIAKISKQTLQSYVTVTERTSLHLYDAGRIHSRTRRLFADYEVSAHISDILLSGIPRTPEEAGKCRELMVKWPSRGEHACN